MASELVTLIKTKADELDQKTATERALALFAFASYLTSRGIAIIGDLQIRSGLDDQEVIDLARKHDAEASAAWEKLKAATEPAG